jgi:hypothetical protein
MVTTKLISKRKTISILRFYVSILWLANMKHILKFSVNYHNYLFVYPILQMSIIFSKEQIISSRPGIDLE